MTRPVVTSLAVAGLLAFTASASLAQGRGPQGLEGTYRTDGSGTTTINGRTDDVRRATLDLERDGSFDLRLDGDRSMTIEGRWVRKSSTQASLTVLEVNNRRARGSGMASINRRGDLEFLDLDGQIGNDSFSLLVRDREVGRTDRPNRPNRPGDDRWIRSLSATREGRGLIRYSRGGDDRIDEVGVTLESDGDARVRIEGEEDFSFSGRWRAESANRVWLDFNESFGRRANSDGTLILDGRGGFRELNITGRNPIIDQTFRLSFNTDSRRVDWEDDRDDWDLGNRRAAGTYSFVNRFVGRGDRDHIRYTLRLERDGRAELVASTNEDLPRDRDSIENNGEILHRLDGRNQVRHIGTWSASGDRVTIRLTSFRSGNRTESEESVFRGTLLGGGEDLRIDEWDRAFYGRNTRFWFERS